MSKKKAAGTTKNNRDSNPKMLGVKVFGGQKVNPGMVLVRQRGTKFHPGLNVSRGGDDTLYSDSEGVLYFSTKSVRAFTGNLKKRTFVNVKNS